jgi:hypothetical protein
LDTVRMTSYKRNTEYSLPFLFFSSLQRHSAKTAVQSPHGTAHFDLGAQHEFFGNVHALRAGKLCTCNHITVYNTVLSNKYCISTTLGAELLDQIRYRHHVGCCIAYVVQFANYDSPSLPSKRRLGHYLRREGHDSTT